MCQMSEAATQAVQAVIACAGTWHPKMVADAEMVVKTRRGDRMSEREFAMVMDWVAMSFKVIARDSERAAESDED